MSLTNADIADILSLLNASQFNELHLKTDNFTLSLTRGGDGAWMQELAVIRAAAADQVEAAPKVEPAKASDAFTDGLVLLPSPMIGTFYRAPKPGAPPYVDVGSEVDPETVVGLIETMKLMTSVYAGVKGRIAEICAADAQFVEQGAVLMGIEPSA